MGIGDKEVGLSSLCYYCLVARSGTIKKRYCKDNVMWGFGLYLMRLADYLAGRSHQKVERTNKTLLPQKNVKFAVKIFLKIP